MIFPFRVSLTKSTASNRTNFTDINQIVQEKKQMEMKEEMRGKLKKGGGKEEKQGGSI